MLIIGSGGLAKELKCLLQKLGHTQVKLVAKNEDKIALSGKWGYELIIGIGDPKARRKAFEKYKEFCFTNVQHPSVIIDGELIQGVGNIICAGTVITTSAKIGDNSIINIQCTLGHDVTIGNHCVINPAVSLSGYVNIEDDCLIGVGSVIKEYVTIGTNSIIGMGSVVTKDIPPNTIAFGNPAVPIRTNDNARANVCQTATDQRFL